MTPTADPRLAAPVDLTLLSVGDFRCRPGCALCCFATPAASPEEVRELTRRVPDLRLLPGAAGFRTIAGRPDGGACGLLNDLRCSAHDLRPFPCREYPIAVHMGDRLQATLVLSCPGVIPARLESWGTVPAAVGVGGGLREELSAVEAEASRPTTGRRARAARRRWAHGARRLLGRDWHDRLEEVREQLSREAESIAARAPPGGDPPEAAAGLERLPLFFDERAGRIALSEDPPGWGLLEIREQGGVAGPPALLPRPPESVAMDAPARRLLTGYLRYWTARDALLGQAMVETEAAEASALLGTLREALEEIASTVKGRGWVWGRFVGRYEPALTPETVLAGIRATDADLLDREGLGETL